MSIEYRLSKVFRPETGNTLILPIDHGVSIGNVKGLESPETVLKDLKTPDVDGVLMAEGIGNHTESMFYGKHSPARILAADVVYSDNNVIHQDLYTSVEAAMRKGYDCMKLIMYWDRPPKEQMKSVQIISEVIHEAEKWEMPVMIEPLTYSSFNDKYERAKILTDGARVAYELGADILKLPHPGDEKTLESWVNDFNVPIILLGGATSGGTEDLIKQVNEAVNIGVRGVAIGRNLWQRPSEEAKYLLAEFAKVIHKNERVKF